MPVQRCTLTLPIPLLPLWTVQPVHNLSACTTVHFNFTYTSTPPYGPYGLYRASVPVQRCTLSLPIPLLPLWTVPPVQSLSACTTVHFTFTYTSSPPIDRTACTDPRCLYNRALYLYLTSNSPMYRTACTEPQCLYNGALYLYLYLYSPYGP